MRILITGAAGFIGSMIVRYAINNIGDVVFNVDKLSYAANLDSLLSVGASNRFRFVRADICDQEWIGGIFAEFKPCAHMPCDSRSPSLHNRIDPAQA